MPFQWAVFLRSPQQARQPFYAGFLPDAASATAEAAAAAAAAAGVAAGQWVRTAAAAAPAALSDAAVTATVAEAVQAALGEGVACGTPLLQAGSLGELLDPHRITRRHQPSARQAEASTPVRANIHTGLDFAGDVVQS